MAISPQTVEEVQKAANVYDVISDYLPLKKAGVNYVALCPFHGEKTPSFVVSPTKNIFKCFGCGVSGDAVKFVMEYEKLSFSEAITKLATKYGIKVRYIGKDRYSQLSPMFEITGKIAGFYADSLVDSVEAKSYIGSRGILPSTVKHFQVGYSPTDINKLMDFCNQNNIQVEKLVEIGLLSDYRNGRFWDKFSGRLIFPIRDIKGNVVAFGGRAIDPNRSPKYLNSPESQIYHKGRVLYGLFDNLEYIKEKSYVVVVEGYMDLISLWQAGIKNVVATLGTAFTRDHAKLLVKYVKDIYLMFDSDNAGKKASIQAAKIIISEGVVPRLVLYEGYKDPDEMAKAGVKIVLETINRSSDIILYIISQIKNLKEIDSQEERLKRYTSLYKILIELLSSIVRPELFYSYINLAAGELGLMVDKLQRDVENAPKSRDADTGEEKNTGYLASLTVNERAVLKVAFEKPYLLKNCDFYDKINISPLLRYYFDLILTENLEEYDDIKNQIGSIEYSVPEDMFYKELLRIHEKETKKLEKGSIGLLNLSEEEKLTFLHKKVLSQKKSVEGGFR